ncbi:MAG: hypothetical protein A3F84_16120 [Candidatus Handelsmanbacteria bacterium RIFCSPLOWO2_12_FULL_64_10]|uniref:Uncharacterized protein n=1 Tax=Handelsmanbacteria sp. (strain RIFCSPLOWO2_12_FULL_64_10) TaxID=1817868 RepID=A0A1F6CKE6_HANXR|nr:MAG: hypothetical protein A3F84_16120 [Candidatus Handelsmanbacteria bacterium RIFCSPLOWO2_12_FULL_64_10]
MDADELAKQLHDKATRGVGLSPDEQAKLDAWYARQDASESAMLAQTSPPQALVALQAQVDAAVAQLLTVTQRIRDLTLQNDALRRDIAALKQQLPRSPAPLTA